MITQPDITIPANPALEYPTTRDRLVSYVDGEVHNYSRAGQDLRDASGNMLDIIGLTLLDADWVGEGARIFAEALSQWSNGEIRMAAVTMDGETPTYVAGYLPPGDGKTSPGMVIDGVGVEWAGCLPERLAALDFPQQGALVTGDQAVELVSGLQFCEDASRTAARALDLTLGDFPSWKAKLAQEAPEPMAFPVADQEHHLPLVNDYDLSEPDPMGGRVHQLTRMGERLQNGLHAIKARQGWDDTIMSKPVGRLITDALAQWSKGRIEPAAVLRDASRPEYAVGRVALEGQEGGVNMLIDDEGLTTPDTLVERMKANELQPQHAPIFPNDAPHPVVFGERARELTKLTAPHKADATREAVDLLTAEAGTFEQWAQEANRELARGLHDPDAFPPVAPSM